MRKRSLVIVLLLLPAVGMFLLLLWWWLRWRSEEARHGPQVEYVIPSTKPASPSEGELVVEPVELVEDRQPDDLRTIEGIGPKIQAALADAGIVTFEQLATSDVEHLRQSLRKGGIRLAFPDTWPEQAALAAADDWDGLRALQAQLRGGRRV